MSIDNNITPVIFSTTTEQIAPSMIAKTTSCVTSLDTHVFTLPAHGSLIWKMKDQPPLTGLEAIRARLDQLRESLEYLVLAEQEHDAQF